MMSIQNSPSSNLIGQVLLGTKTNEKWKVERLLPRPKNSTGGFFSIGYVVSDSRGKEFFMKATDHSLYAGTMKANRFEKKTAVMNFHKFEREMLDICSNSAMNRVVHAVDYGDIELIHNHYLEDVYFLVFEMAKSNIRTETQELRKVGYSWIPRFINNFSLAVTQLHNKQITHNNIKPSNVLFFDSAIQKISDLGRATSKNIAGPYDNERCAGNLVYLAPEVWEYVNFSQVSEIPVPINERKLCDVYMLGSLIYFILTGVPLNTTILSLLDNDLRQVIYDCKFSDILPILEDAHVISIEMLRKELSDNYGSDALFKLNGIIEYVKHLTVPNPLKRGDPLNSKRGLQQYDLQRLISYTDRLTKIYREMK